MLRILKKFSQTILVAAILAAIGVCKADDDVKWATDLSDSSTEMVWKSLKEKFEEQEVSRRSSGLYVFVSTSMSKQLLKNYLAEATKYGGTLVFKGLPNGSFKELIKVVTELVGENNDKLSPNLQVDDEAFDMYGVISVPTIVLSKMDEYHPNQNNKVIYDKIVGNVGIKYGLEKFSESGELQKEALEYLNGYKH